jgi:hypothetical protein
MNGGLPVDDGKNAGAHQGHLGWGNRPFAKVLNILQTWAARGVPMKITDDQFDTPSRLRTESLVAAAQ